MSKTLKLGMHRYHFFTNRYEYEYFYLCTCRYRYFLDLVSVKVQLIWRQILFYPLQIMSSLWYKINRRLSQAKNKQSFLVLTHKKSLQTDNIITLDKMQI